MTVAPSVAGGDIRPSEFASVAAGFSGSAAGIGACGGAVPAGDASSRALLLVDGNSIANRAHYALSRTARMTSPDGVPTGAVYGFITMLQRRLRATRPTHACVAFDLPAPTFRKERYPAYKANRKPMPEDLAAQMPLIKEAVKAMGLQMAEKPGYEADDAIATLSALAESDGMQVIVFTGDRDALQLASGLTTIELPITRAGGTSTESYDASGFELAYGIPPALFVDVKALMGDKSDNIPGVPGVGEKTAFELVKAFGGLDGIYTRADEIQKKGLRERLLDNKDTAYLCKWLATVCRDAPLGVSVADLCIRAWDKPALHGLFLRLGFSSLISKMGLGGCATGAVGAASAHTEAQNGSDAVGDELGARATDGGQAKSVPGAGAPRLDAYASGDPGTVFAREAAAAVFPQKDVGTDAPPSVNVAHGVQEALELSRRAWSDADGFAVWPLFERPDGLNWSLRGIAVYGPSFGSAYIPCESLLARFEGQSGMAQGNCVQGNCAQGNCVQGNCLQGGAEQSHAGQAAGMARSHAEEQREIWRGLRPLLYGEGGRMAGHDVKRLCHWAFRYGDPGAPGGVPPCPRFDFDAMVAGYAIDSGAGQYSMSSLYAQRCGGFVDEIEALLGKGKSQLSIAEAPELKLREAAASLARACHRSWAPLAKAIGDNGQEDLYYGLELPLSEALASMEAAGVFVDVPSLEAYAAELDGKVKELESEIYALAGGEFNINSPRQLGATLFDKLGLPTTRKTKTGYSTDADALDEISGMHPIVRKVVEYRQHAKLKATYADALPRLVNPETGRVHTMLNQCVTATGRISSQEPNLQNIPARLPLGREIRRAFMPQSDGCALLGADYSQIELRVLAHLASDDAMADAFRRGADIHTATAASVFHVPETDVTESMRTKAKAVNFGIVYGIGEFSLAKDIGVSRAEAKAYIEGYLALYEGVRRFMAEAVESCRAEGFARTIMNRRRSVPEISSPNRATRAFGERVAMNTPVQGSAADIIKVAMLRAYKELARRGLKSRLILQVHDELVVEAAKGELDEAAAALRDAMENAVALDVPLAADVYCGANWRDAQPYRPPCGEPDAEPACPPCGEPGAEAVRPPCGQRQQG